MPIIGMVTTIKFDLPGVAGRQVFTVGGSARFVVHPKDMPVAPRIKSALARAALPGEGGKEA